MRMTYYVEYMRHYSSFTCIEFFENIVEATLFAVKIKSQNPEYMLFYGKDAKGRELELDSWG